MAKKEENKFLTYKDKPLVRCGNTIYYGNMSDPYVVLLQIAGSKENDGLNMADRVVRLHDGMIRKNYLNETKLTAEELDW